MNFISKFCFFLFFIFSVLISCKSDDVAVDQVHKIYIDNPTANKYELFINGQRNKVKPNSTEILELEDGEFHFKCLNEDGKIIFEEKILIDTTILLNITKSKYILSTTMYGNDTKGWKDQKLDTLVDDDNTYIGKYTLLDQNLIFYKKSWHYDLDQPLPDTIDIGSTVDFRSKIYLQSSYIKHYYE